MLGRISRTIVIMLAATMGIVWLFNVLHTLNFKALAIGTNPLETTAFHSSFDYIRDNSGQPKILSGDPGAVIPIISLNQLPAGPYLVTFSANINNMGSCSLDLNNFGENPQQSLWQSQGNNKILFTQPVTMDVEGSLTVYCQAGSFEQFQAGLTALKVNVLNTTP